jgi:hypothetical protein
MNRFMRATSFALACCVSTTAISQSTLVVGGAAPLVLRAGTPVPMTLSEPLTTERKKLRAGQRFEIETAEAISLNGRVVIPAGSHGVGEVTDVRNKGMWGKSGHIDVRPIYVQVGDRRIGLTGTGDDKGHAGGVAAVAVSALLFLPAGFFMTGTSARMPIGTPLKAFLDEDVPVAFADNSGPAPLIVGNAPQPAAGAVQTVSQVTMVAPPLPAPAPTPAPTTAAPPPAVSHATTVASGLPIYTGDADGKYQIIGAVQATANNIDPKTPAGQAKIYGKLWDKAKALGADAVIHAAIGEGHVAAFSDRKVDVTGVAIKFDARSTGELASRR